MDPADLGMDWTFVRDVAEYVAQGLLFVVGAVLIGSGYRARKKARDMKGNLRLVSGFALLVLLGLAIFGSTQPANVPAEPTSATPTITAEPAKKFDKCSEATDEVERLDRSVLRLGGDGDVKAMMAALETQLRTQILNDKCFSDDEVALAERMVPALSANPLPVTVEARLAPSCRDVIVDATRLLTTAAARRQAGDAAGAKRLSGGFKGLSGRHKDCLPSAEAKILEEQLDKVPLGSQTP